eukprot:jgi/Undpi1/6950/HiC_scaffold_21.g09424.m1
MKPAWTVADSVVADSAEAVADSAVADSAVDSVADMVADSEGTVAGLVLEVRVCQAQGLKKVQMLGKQDPYVRAKLYFDGQKASVE